MALENNLDGEQLYKDIFHAGNWQRASYSERLSALQKLENEYAGKQGRIPCLVVPASMESIYHGGRYDGKEKKIYLNEAYLAENICTEDAPVELPLYSAVATIIHEGRHAYQHYAMENPGKHNNQEDLRKWKENKLVYYLEGESYKYRFQPLERDAHNYAEAECDKLYVHLEEKYGINEGYEWFQKNIVRKSIEKYAEIARPVLGDNFTQILGEMTDEMLHGEYEKIIDKERNNSKAKGGMIDRLQEIQKTPDVRELRHNASSKALYNAYAKEVIGKTGEWKNEVTDREIVLRMLKDGRSVRHIQEAMWHSPAMEKLLASERVVRVYEKVKEVLKDPQAQDLIKKTREKEKGLER